MLALIGPLAKGISSAMRPRYCATGHPGRTRYRRGQDASPAATKMHRSCISDDFEAGDRPAQCTRINHASHDGPGVNVSRHDQPKDSPRDGAPACAGLQAWHWRRGLYFAPARKRGRRKIALPSRGTSPCSDDLKQLVEAFEKDQPLSGDSLALLQGAQAVLARVNTALRSRGFYDARATATVDNQPSTRPRRSTPSRRIPTPTSCPSP